MLEVLKLALEAWQTSVYGSDKHHKAMLLAMTKMNQAIAELESQEPFCYVYKENGEEFFAPKDGYLPADATPLYTHPPQSTWVGLTDEEINACDPSEECWDLHKIAKAIEAKLKEKNT